MAIKGRADRPEDIIRAAELLLAGQLVAFPTETVYGLGADATSGPAVAAIFGAKQRPAFNPLISHLADAGSVEAFALWNEAARALAQAFWPGALTLVLPRREHCAIAHIACAGLNSVALRVPSHPAAHALLAATGRPIAAPSANRSGRISPTTAAHVALELGDEVALILDGGPCDIGLESTVVGFHRERPVLLRPGGIAVEQLRVVVGAVEVAVAAPAAPSAPGQLTSHYAPDKPLRLNAREAAPGEILLGFGPGSTAEHNLSPSGDLIEAAARLFAMLRRLDLGPGETIAVAPIPDHGLGRAINDRLQRAAAPRI
ncbi:MAG: L-threonylcarbamoyladenylate synthase [Proteobacteria bacterium]|nr:L-threonylcarbamoyladenylate synthase [Pseudomonadota bacterium]